MHHLFKGSVIEQVFSERPRCRFGDDWQNSYIEDLKTKIENHHHEIAAMILEPIVQGAGGMWFYSPVFLRKAKELCDKYQILLIADEIATGFGRTGKMFACEWAEISPDIMCVGKALTGGYLGLAATLTTKHVAEVISKNGDVFMHGPTFMANPLACAVAVKSVELLLKMNWRDNVGFIQNLLKTGLSELKQLEAVLDVRVLGAIGVVEMKEAVDIAEFQKKCVQAGVWIRPFGRLVYVMPPYIITEAQLKKLITVIKSIIG
jgi:adenosylmethionine-8-amino-7-oxononanoate aminotransferase